MTWLLISDLDKNSCKHDKTSSLTISPIVESNCHITKQGLTELKSRLVIGVRPLKLGVTLDMNVGYWVKKSIGEFKKNTSLDFNYVKPCLVT